MEKPVEPPHVRMPVETLIQEQGTGDRLLWIEGLLPLPIGSRINLDHLPGDRRVPLDPERFPTGRTDAVVANVSLWGPQSAIGCLVLEVELTELVGSGELQTGG
jgi:hypothetical protein